MTNRLSINFILPFIGKTGGIAVVLEYTRNLKKRGHDVKLYYPLLPYRALLKKGKGGRVPVQLIRFKVFLKNLFELAQHIRWFREPMPVVPIPFIHSAFLRDADAAIATAWPTAFDVARLPEAKGRKYYFVQDYEVWDADAAIVDETYRLPLKLIVIAPWLRDLMKEKFGRDVEAEIHNGIDLDWFKPPVERNWSHPSILMVYNRQAAKGSQDGLEALRRLKAKHPEVTIRAFGLYEFPPEWSFVEYHLNPPQAKILELYHASTIFLSPSRIEGWGLPVMEALACGCAVVATNVGCVPVLKADGNMLAAEPGDVDSIFRQLLSLVEDPELSRNVSRKGLATIADHGWERHGLEFERVLASGKAALAAGART